MAPEIEGAADEVPFPWRVLVDDVVFAVDFLRTIPASRLRERTDRASHTVMQAVRPAPSPTSRDTLRVREGCLTPTSPEPLGTSVAFAFGVATSWP